MRLREVRITSGSKLSGLVVTQISRNVLSSSAEETDESFTGGACRRDTQMDAEQGIHAVVRDDGSYKAVAARRNGGDESHGILFIMGISALEEIQVIVFHVFFEDAGFYVFVCIEINYFCH